MDAKLRYSNAVRKRTIDAAIQLLCKAGCDVETERNGNHCVLTVYNAPDPIDVHGERLKEVAGHEFNK